MRLQEALRGSVRIVKEGRWVRSPARKEASRDVKFGEAVEEGEGGEEG